MPEYHEGGFIEPGAQVAINLREEEYILRAAEWQAKFDMLEEELHELKRKVEDEQDDE